MSIFFDPTSGRPQVWACGGGVQSTAIAVLIRRGLLPKPDFAVMADTGREKSATFRYLNAHTIPMLAEVGVTLRVVDKAKYATVDLTRTTPTATYILLPAYTTQSGSVGKLTNFCSGEWKRDVMARWLREQGVRECDNWLGFSLDEFMGRAGADRPEWMHKVYPLVELRMSRKACIQVVTDYGLPPAPRSACWMCSNMSDDEWREMKVSDPGDFAKAVELDRDMREMDPHFWLHHSCRPLDEVDFSEPVDGGLFAERGCRSGLCFT